MKIKNLAFFGIMAAIMGVAGTARADTTTVIASQAYVDAKDELDEKTANKETATYTDSTNKTSTTVYPSMATLKDAYDTLNTAISNVNLADAVSGLDLSEVSDSGKPIVSVSQEDGQVSASVGTITTAGIANTAIATSISATGSTSNEKLATETAVRGAIDELDNATATGDGTVVKSVTQTNGVITADMGKISNTDVADNAAIADSKIAFTEAHASALDSGITSTKVSDYDTTTTTVDSATDANVVATRTANTNLLKGTGLQKAVAHLKGNGAENYTANVDNSTDENTGIKNATVSEAAKTAWKATLSEKKGDDYLTTLAAVERRVQEGVQDAVSQAGNNVTSRIGSDTKSATENNMVTSVTTTNGVVTAVGSAQVTDDYVASNAGIASTKLNVGTGYDSSSATGDVTTSDSVQTALAKIENKADNAGTNAINGLDLTDTANNKPVTAVNQTDGQIAVTRGTISYAEGLKYDLSNINTQGGNGSSACVQGSPCTLTMFMNNGTPVYEWTNMDTESTDAVL